MIVNTVQVKMSGNIIFVGMSNISNAGYHSEQIELNLHQLHVYNKGFVVGTL